MKWADQYILYLLWLLIPTAWIIYALLKRREKKLRQLVDEQALSILLPIRTFKRIRARNIYWLLAIALCLIALARPQWGFRWVEVKQRGLDIMVVLDTSNSMLAEDIKPSRLQQAKWGIRDLLSQLQGDRVGLTVFAGSSFLECPLTVDYAAFMMTLDDVYAGIIPKGGTAIEQALKTAIDGFEDDSEADKAIVLITDGEDHEGNPLSMIKTLKNEGIRVYAIGVGTLGGELVPSQEPGGFFKDRQGNVVKSSLKEDVLKQLALETGGAYVRSAAGDFGLERVFSESIDALKRSEQEERMAKIYEDRYLWFAGLGLILLIIEALMSEKGFFRREAAS